MALEPVPTRHSYPRPRPLCRKLLACGWTQNLQFDGGNTSSDQSFWQFVDDLDAVNADRRGELEGETVSDDDGY